MHKNASLILRILSSSVCISEKAGSIIREIIKKGNLNIIDKGFNELQTEADRSSEKCIVKSLVNKFPKLSVIGEENLGINYEVPADWIVTKQDETVLVHDCPSEFQNLKEEDDVVVWVDPLDGTSEFTQGLHDHVTILIGLSVNGKAVGGVIHQPFFNYNEPQPGRTVWGLIGLGAFGIPRIMPPSNKMIVTTTRSHSNETINKAVEAFSPNYVVRVGGAGNKVLQVIEGKAHAYVFASRGCKKWDTCAPEAILHSFGGRLTDCLGNDLTYKKKENFTNELGVLASYSRDEHEKYCSFIPTEIKGQIVEKAKSFFKCL
ncbi:3'(2'),5'-bisphosphate nucleotidase 1 [Dermatophagoides farinae]|uniref:3'(2'),5'-bisphosphate nucleotidase 1 n=1 Tax=Dermatophagoides farinae TaxID=6954 RepID=A0A922I041_DERFA|nr:3'(2'),5'-bisphosphate nucleotidase 1-like [Dermatophagoides farinae]KAH7645832.1 3'(2'),5'-bisphosphate nucleotidase 1-like protein [Dermatophagoides farinae]KAH9516053.1 3'(2'),5'-bisphosphate nucleotidase 1 [Dermatophagoides farinae]